MDNRGEFEVGLFVILSLMSLSSKIDLENIPAVVLVCSYIIFRTKSLYPIMGLHISATTACPRLQDERVVPKWVQVDMLLGNDLSSR